MKINFSKIETYKPELKTMNQGGTIGSILKWHRKSRNLTLHEGSAGICSISYLSKVENNLIEPSQEILELLKKRFDLEKLIDYDLKRIDEIYNEIINSFFHNKNIPNMYYTLHNNNKDFKSRLVVYAYYINTDLINKAFPIYSELESEISKFDLKEINLFFYLTAQLLNKSGRYYNALRFLSLINLQDKDDLLLYLSQILEVSLLLKLTRFVQAESKISKLTKSLLSREYFDKYRQLNYCCMLYTLKEYDYDTMLDKINSLKNYSKIEKQYLLMILNILFDYPEKNIKYLNNIYESEKWYMLTLINYDLEENFQAISNAISTKPKFKNSIIIEQLEFFLKTKYTQDHESLLRYINFYCNKITENFNGLLFLKLLLSNASNYYEKQSYYKTANSIRKIKQNITKSLKNTLVQIEV